MIFSCHTMENHYIEYYLNQAGEKVYSHNKEKYHHSKILTKGSGVGGVFSNVFRYLKPFIASGLDILKEESIKTAADLLLGISQQKPIQKVLSDRSEEMIDKLRDTAVKKIKTITGGNLKKPLKRPKKSICNQFNVSTKQAHTPRKKYKKKKEKDIFN